MKIIARLMCVLAMAVAALPAMADSISGSLTVANANLATQGAGPYANFTITGVSGGNGTTTFTTFTFSGTGVGNFVFGDGGVVGLNLSSAAGAGTLIVASCSSTCSSGGAGNEDGFGSFNFTVNDGNGFSSPHGSFSFNFTTANAVSAADLLSSNGTASVAGHLALSTNTACTGFAANGGTQGQGTVDNSACTAGQPPPVPEPASLILFGTGLSGLGLFARRKLKQ